jgi:holliday junction DNA helicase RuvA
MISRLNGKLSHKSASRIVLMTSGVGFEILISLKTFERLPDIGSDLDIETHLHVKEDELKLVGFLDPREKELFLKLLTVSGISVRIALNCLSFYSVKELCNMIAGSDSELIKRIPGIGKRLAERIVIELREKIGQAEFESKGPVFESEKETEVKDALRSLGYSNSEIANALKKLSMGSLKTDTTEVILRRILKEVYDR